MPRRTHGDTDEMIENYGDQEFNPKQPHDGEQPQDGDQPQDQPQDGDQDSKAAKDEATAAAITAIKAAVQAPPELVEATVPVRKRNALQKAMDEIAQTAYQAWIDAGRPTVWAKMPVITYFLSPEQVPEWRKMIRKACDFVTPEEGAPGVRVRFGKEAFVLSEEMAANIGKPEEAGKTVLSWGAVNKRKLSKSNGDEAAPDDDEGNDDDE